MIKQGFAKLPFDLTANWQHEVCNAQTDTVISAQDKI